MSEHDNGTYAPPPGFTLAAPDPHDSMVKMWLSGDQFFADLWSFFAKFEDIFSDSKNHIVCLTRGAGAHVTVIGNGAGRSDILTMQAKSYAADGRQEKEVAFTEPLPPGLGLSKDGEGWVFVDDLSDTGNTIRAIKDRWPKATVLTVYAKPQGKDHPDGYHLLIPDIWLVFPGEKPWSQFIPFKQD